MDNTYLETMSTTQNKNNLSMFNQHLNQDYMYEQGNKQPHEKETVDILSTSDGRKSMYNVGDDAQSDRMRHDYMQTGSSSALYQESEPSNAYHETTFRSQGLTSREQTTSEGSRASEQTELTINQRSVSISCDNKIEIGSDDRKNYCSTAEVTQTIAPAVSLNEINNHSTTGSRPSTTGNGHNTTSGDKSEAFDLYSFWNTFDPNEMSPEPSPEPKSQAIQSEPNNLQLKVHVDYASSQQPVTKSNVGYNPTRRISQQDELQISSAIAASQLSSAVMKQTNAFRNGMDRESAFQPTSNVIGNSIAMVSNAPHLKEHYQKPTDCQYVEGNQQHFHSMAPRHSTPFNNFSNHSDMTIHHNPRRQQFEQTKFMHHESNMGPSTNSYRGVQAPTPAGLQSMGQQINRFPSNPHPSRNDPFNFPLNNPPRNFRAQYMCNNPVASHTNSVFPRPIKHYYTQHSMQAFSTSPSLSSQHPLYDGNSPSNRLATAYTHSKHTVEQLPKRNTSESTMPNYSLKQWSNSHARGIPSAPSITAASNNLINNSIIYKPSLPIMHNNGIYNQPPQTTVTYPPTNCTYSTASIPKPWDYIPKYNVQRDRHQQQVQFNPPEKYQYPRHSVTLPTNSLHGDKPSNEFYSTTYQDNSRFPSSTCNQNPESVPNFNRYGAQPHTDNTPETHHQIYGAQTKPSMVTPSHTAPKTYSTMSDLNTIVDQVLECVVNNETVKNVDRSLKQNVPNINTAVKTSKCGQMDSNGKELPHPTSSGTLCYNCGAFVSSATVADDETTIAICHNCKEVLYFVSDEHTTKEKKPQSLENTVKKIQEKTSNCFSSGGNNNTNAPNG